MNKDCEVVRDLLPLYVDEVCSPASRELVDGHLSGCEDCTAILKRLRDSATEETLNVEMTGVLTRQAKRFRRKSTVVGMVFAGVLLLPVLICLIVVLADGYGYDWFFILLCSLMLAASLTVVPLVLPERKFLWTMGSFTLSLLLLLGVCCRYTAGSWFFTAASACVFGLSVVFLPIAVYREPIKSALGNAKGVSVMGVDTALLCLMLYAIGRKNVSWSYWESVLCVLLPCLLYAWVLFLLIRYPKAHGMTKAGFCMFWTGAFVFGADCLSALLAGDPEPLPKFHPLIWTASQADDNIFWLILLVFLLIGMIFTISGIVAKRRKRK